MWNNSTLLKTGIDIPHSTLFLTTQYVIDSTRAIYAFIQQTCYLFWNKFGILAHLPVSQCVRLYYNREGNVWWVMGAWVGIPNLSLLFCRYNFTTFLVIIIQSVQLFIYGMFQESWELTDSTVVVHHANYLGGWGLDLC